MKQIKKNESNKINELLIVWFPAVINSLILEYFPFDFLDELLISVNQLCVRSKEVKASEPAEKVVCESLQDSLSKLRSALSDIMEKEKKSQSPRKRILSDLLLYSKHKFSSPPYCQEEAVSYNLLDRVCVLLICCQVKGIVSKNILNLILDTRSSMLACVSLISLETYTISYPLITLMLEDLASKPDYEQFASHRFQALQSTVFGMDSLTAFKNRHLLNGQPDSYVGRRFQGRIFTWLKANGKIEKPRVTCVGMSDPEGVQILLGPSQAQIFKALAAKSGGDTTAYIRNDTAKLADYSFRK